MKTAYLHYIVRHCTSLHLPCHGSSIQWSSEAGDEVRGSSSCSLVDQPSLCFSTTESASASLGKWCKFTVNAVKALNVHTEHVSFKFDATSSTLLLEQTSLSLPDAFRMSMANHNASHSSLSHLCASPKSLQGPVLCLPLGGHSCGNGDFKRGFSC